MTLIILVMTMTIFILCIILLSLDPLYIKHLVDKIPSKSVVPVFKSSDIKIVDSNDNYNFIDIVTSDNMRKRIDYAKYKEYLNKKNQKNHNNLNKEKSCSHETEEIKNILLVGIDSRTKKFKYGRADTIIIASINKSRKEIKLISILRDTYVKIPGYRNNRINVTYNYGGVKLLEKSINANFNLDLDKYIIVNFVGFEKLIDDLGGITVGIKKYEVNELNRCISGLRRSRSNYVRSSGEKHLNGVQALAYCRIRKVGNSDYERTERQRTVMKLIIEKLNNLSFTKYPSLIANLHSHVKTNLSIKECMNLIKDYYYVDNWNISGIQIPTEKHGKPKKINSMWVIDPNTKECTKVIEEFLLIK